MRSVTVLQSGWLDSHISLGTPTILVSYTAEKIHYSQLYYTTLHYISTHTCTAIRYYLFSYYTTIQNRKD